MRKEWLIFTFTMVTLIVTAMGFFLSGQHIKERYGAQLKDRTENVSKALEKYQNDVLNHYEVHLRELIECEPLYKFLKAKKEKSNEANSFKFMTEISFLESVLRHLETTYAKFINNEGQEIISIKNKKISKNYINYSNNADFMKLVKVKSSQYIPIKTSQNNCVVNLVSPIYEDDKKVGVVVIGYSYRYISQLFDRLAIKENIDNIFTLDNTSNIIYSNNKSQLLKNLNADLDYLPRKISKDGLHLYKENYIYIKSMPKFNLKFGVMIYKTTMENFLTNIAKDNLIIFTICGFLILFLCIWVIRMISSEFNLTMKKVVNSENYLKTVLHMMTNMLFVLDAKTLKIKSINQSVFITLGYDENDLIGKPISSILSENNSPDKKNEFSKTATINNLELVLKHKNNKDVNVVISKSEMEGYDESKKPRLVCIAKKIS